MEDIKKNKINKFCVFVLLGCFVFYSCVDRQREDSIALVNKYAVKDYIYLTENVEIIKEHFNNINCFRRLFSKSENLDNKFFEGYFKLWESQTDSAMMIFENILIQEPSHLLAKFGKLNCMARSRNYSADELEKFAESFESKDSVQGVINFLLGENYLYEKNYKKAKHKIDLSIKALPNFSRNYLHKSTLYLKDSLMADFHKSMQKAIDLNPKSVVYYLIRIHFRELEKNYKGLLEDYTELIKLSSTLSEKIVRMSFKSKIYEKMGDFNNAEKELKQTMLFDEGFGSKMIVDFYIRNNKRNKAYPYAIKLIKDFGYSIDPFEKLKNDKIFLNKLKK